MSVLDDAFAETARSGLRYWTAELHRRKGVILLSIASGKEFDVESCSEQAIEIAREQGAKSLELRAATSLARLWRDQGKSREAYDMLAPVYGWFTEGFDTADLKEAKLLLDEFS